MKNKIYSITLSAVLTAFSLSLFAVELLIPPFPFCPWAKIGLANIVTLFMLTNPDYFRPRDCFLVLICRCLLASFITGQLMSVVFSLAGGALAFLIMLFIAGIMGQGPVISGIFGAVFHNFGQLLTAVLFYGTFSAVYYIPALVLTGTAAGALTGVCVLLINKSGFYKKFLNSRKV